MRRILVLLSAIVTMFVATVASATVGVVDMEKIFHQSSQVQAINDSLSKQFTPRKNKILDAGKQLQADIQNYQKNKDVMSKDALTTLQSKIMQEENDVRQSQTQFQQDLYTAQTEQMNKLMDKVRDIVSSIAKKQNIDTVFLKNSVLYSSNDSDLTDQVIKQLK